MKVNEQEYKVVEGSFFMKQKMKRKSTSSERKTTVYKVESPKNSGENLPTDPKTQVTEDSLERLNTP